VTWGSKRGGTAGIGMVLAETLETDGFEVVTAPAEKASVEGADAVIVGGALYANRWASPARRFVRRNAEELRKVPVWFFSSGPLDESADSGEIPATPEVAVLAERVGAKGHMTFGGRLEPDVRGFPASAMAKKSAGDWRSAGHVRSWARRLASELPGAVPGRWVDPPGGSALRLIGYGVVGWALCTVTMLVLLQVTSTTVALVAHAIAAPIYFVVLAGRYFGARGAREPLEVAATWTGSVVLLDATLIAGVVLRSFEMFGSVLGTWLPLALIFVASWLTGIVKRSMPPPGRDGSGPKPGSSREAVGGQLAAR